MKIIRERHEKKSGGTSTLSYFDWNTFDPDDALERTRTLLEEGRALVDSVAKKQPLNFDELVLPFEIWGEKLSEVWGPMGHMNNVMQDAYPTLRERFEEGDALLTRYNTEVGQHEGLYRAYRAYAESEEFGTLDEERSKIVKDALIDFRISGVALSHEDRERLKGINMRLSELGNRYSNNIQSAQNEWSYELHDVNVLSGVPRTTCDAMAARAKHSGKEGWLVTLHQPIYISIIEHCDDRSFRALMYRAFHTRASADTKQVEAHDNLPLMEEIILLRDQKAKLLGFSSFNEYSLLEKTAPGVDQVSNFLAELLRKAAPKAKRELNILRDYARDELGIDDVMPWDVAYVSEKMKKKEFNIDQEELRSHFTEEGVFAALFGLCKKIYGVTFAVRSDVPSWDQKVRFFEMRGEDGEIIAGVYADLYARDGKRPGAWMDTAFERCNFFGDTQLPVAYFNCNFTEPKNGERSFLRHDEIETVFHEFGHVMHHLLLRTRYPSSGMSGVEWDAIESPSQIMENWVWEEDMLRELSSGGDVMPLSETAIEQLQKTRVYNIGMFLTRQLSLALFDWNLHLKRAAGDVDIYDLWQKVQEETVPLPSPSWSRYVNTFSHIFDGGYAAGYFSYLWAEVLALDMYQEFKKHGIYDHMTGEKFRSSVLSRGGSRSILTGVREFLGREPSPDALLSQYGVSSQ